MKVSIEKKGPCRKIMTVELPVETVRDEYNEILKNSVRFARIPGFRKGRAPINLVENHYGREIREETQERLVGRTFREALKKVNVDPVMLLNLDANLQKEQPLVYRLTMDVAPEFKLPRYKGIPLKLEKLEVTDEMVEKSLKQLQEGFSKYEDADDRAICEDDLVILDFDATIDGRPLKKVIPDAAGLDRGRNIMLVANEQGTFLPGLDEQLLGLKVSDEKSFEITFPTNFTQKSLAGKTVTYHVKIKKVRVNQPAQMNDEFFKRFEVADETQLRAKIRDQLMTQSEATKKERQEEEIIRYLLAKTTLDLPESLAQEETLQVFYSIARRAIMQGMTREQVAERQEEIRATAAATAADRIKTRYILHRIAGEEKITVTDDEVDSEISKLAPRYRMDKDQLRKQLYEDQQMDALRHDILSRKVLEFLLANAKIGEEGFLTRLMGGGRKPTEENASN